MLPARCLLVAGLIYLVVTSVDSKRRKKRRVGDMSTTLQNTIVRVHNELRASEGSDNMRAVRWNNELARHAYDWATNCFFKRGYLLVRAEKYTYSRIGQNLYRATSRYVDPEAVIREWYAERSNYDKANNQCYRGTNCGNYTQLVWADTWEIGCAKQVCLRTQTFRLIKGGGSLFVCNYGPRGNWPGEIPFTRGVACTKCRIGTGWCRGYLCVKELPGLTMLPRRQSSFVTLKERDLDYLLLYGLFSDCAMAGYDALGGCSCGAICDNCGTYNSDDCSCTCTQGWIGPGCSGRCRNLDVKCETTYKKSYCKDERLAFVAEKCPVLCGLCVDVHTLCLKLNKLPRDGATYSFDGGTLHLWSSFFVGLLIVYNTYSDDYWLCVVSSRYS